MRVSLCVVCRDEAEDLPACLLSVADLVEEVIVVADGATEHAKASAAPWGARVYDAPATDSLAALRNEALRHAAGDWILYLDADEWLDDANRERLRKLLADLRDENAAYVMRLESKAGEPGQPAVPVDQVRLFRRHPEVRWEFPSHPQILPALRRVGGQMYFTDITIARTQRGAPV